MKSAPAYLSKTSQQWVNKLLTEFDFEQRHKFLLLLAADTWDQIETIRKAIKKDGIVTVDRFKQRKQHPLLKEQRLLKKVFASLLRDLGLDNEDNQGPEIPKYQG